MYDLDEITKQLRLLGMMELSSEQMSELIKRLCESLRKLIDEQEKRNCPVMKEALIKELEKLTKYVMRKK